MYAAKTEGFKQNTNKMDWYAVKNNILKSSYFANSNGSYFAVNI